MRGSSWLAANQLASQEGLWIMEWVSKYVSKQASKGKSQLRYRIDTDQINFLSTLNHTYLESGYRSFAIVILVGLTTLLSSFPTTSHTLFLLCRRVLSFPLCDPLVVILSAFITFFVSIFSLSAPFLPVIFCCTSLSISVEVWCLVGIVSGV